MAFQQLAMRAASKPPRVVVFKLVQKIRLALEAARQWRPTRRRAMRLAAGVPRSARVRLLTAGGASAAAEYLRAAPDLATRLRAACEEICAGRYEVFRVAVPLARRPWCEDWRFGYAWPNQDFRRYNFYAKCDQPVDVKFPWELSRLACIVRLLEGAVLLEEERYAHEALALLTDWRESNPLAGSVNWVPMEASMRCINLCLARDLSVWLVPRCPEPATRLLSSLTGMIAEHGEFVWLAREYTDNRGNHYAANIAALICAGAQLLDDHSHAAHWTRWGRRELEKEIPLQFLPDGVNFEKSVAYHRLVTELFLLATIVMEADGYPLSGGARDRLHRASRYALACRAPDGRAVNAGDNDDAVVLDFDVCDVRDHRGLIALASVLFDDSEMALEPPAASLAPALLLGRNARSAKDLQQGICDFPDGGVVTWRGGNDHFWMDLGEVGQNGLGGHGHNDILSFTLVLNGAPLIVDAGTYYYTGDLEARRWFRGTSAHNGLQVDGAEIAPLLGHWRMGNDARPRDVRVERRDAGLFVTGAHTGYERLPDPVTHARSVTLEPAPFRLYVRDELFCKGRHVIVRRLHFAPNCILNIAYGGAIAQYRGCLYTVRWNAGARPVLTQGWVSDHYGQRSTAPVLELFDDIDAAATLAFTIQNEAALR